MSSAATIDSAAPAATVSAAGACEPPAVPSGAPAIVPEPAGRAPVQPVQAVRRARWWIEGLTVACLLWVYDAVTNLAPLQLGPALSHGRSILHLEQRLGMSPERALDGWLASHRTLGLILSDYYDNAHFIVTLGLLGWLWWRRSDAYRSLRSALVLINLLAFVVFWLFPVAPPRMLDGFVDVVASSHAIGSWHTGSLASQANQLAAMPSLHIAWAVWCSVVLWRAVRRPWGRVAAVAYPCTTAFAVLATGNHYVLDILGGVVVTAVALGMVAVARVPWRGRASSVGTAV